MTAEEWDRADDIPVMKYQVRFASARKQRLFSCACARHFGTILGDGTWDESIELTERYSDGATTKVALKQARQKVRAARHSLDDATVERSLHWVALWLSELAASENAYSGISAEIDRLGQQGLFQRQHHPPMADFLRDIFGNPFRPVTLDPRWQSSTVLDLARTIYDQRVFGIMPILGDALMDAGCDNAEMIQHCQGPGVHVRGCWVVDLLLGKS